MRFYSIKNAFNTFSPRRCRLLDMCFSILCVFLGLQTHFLFGYVFDPWMQLTVFWSSRLIGENYNLLVDIRITEFGFISFIDYEVNFVIKKWGFSLSLKCEDLRLTDDTMSLLLTMYLIFLSKCVPLS